jgi:predicted amidohydrolase
VCPGLIDLHTHLYHKVSKIGLDVDAACLAEGVTTSVDAGSAGSITFAGFRDYCVLRAKSRVYAFVNLASIGLIDAGVGELRDMIYADAEGAAATVEANRDICLGIKIRMGEQFVNGAGLRPLELCLEAADRECAAEGDDCAITRADEFDNAVPTGFEPAISSLTGTYARPLHHGTMRYESVLCSPRASPF